jgi:radical SAM protein with 4Fe4S-binding SPASM domain
MECVGIPKISSAEFVRRMSGNPNVPRIPWSCSVEVTARCNLNCVQCYINRPLNDSAAVSGELGTQQMYRLLEEMKDEGCLWVLFTGGEPFVRDDFIEIYTYAKKNGMIPTLFTNGTTITPAIADHLAEYPPQSIEITLYGITDETYERITRVPGSHARCLQGIELLLSRGLSVVLKAVVLTLNKHEIPAMKAFAEDLGLEFRFDPVLQPRLDRGTCPTRFRISPEEIVELDLADEKRMKSWREFISKFLSPPSDPDLLYNCGAGLGGFHVDSHGQMSLCMVARQPAYDLREGSVHEAWSEFVPAVRAQKRTKNIPCRRCELISLCGQCPGSAWLNGPDQEEPVEYLCRLAHARARAFVGWSDRLEDRNAS